MPKFHSNEPYLLHKHFGHIYPFVVFSPHFLQKRVRERFKSHRPDGLSNITPGNVPIKLNRVKDRFSEVIAVRILPMSDRLPGFVGKTVEQVQRDFFHGRLVKAKGLFRYPKNGLAAEHGAAVLFQFKAQIIATAMFVRDEKYERPTDGFAGAMHFDVSSIRTFEPWDADAVRSVWPGFRGFGHVKQRLNPGNWPAFTKRMAAVTPARPATRNRTGAPR
ncbi:MAG: hypothetical protein QM754_13870 [Tepidisphaeraceae bacterium]